MAKCKDDAKEQIMRSNALTSLTIKGFKSIRELVDFELTDLNVIIGANGAGKSNLISFFWMLQSFINGWLNQYVTNNGGAGDLLFNGRKTTQQMEFEVRFGIRSYRFTLVPTPRNTCVTRDEARYYKYGKSGWWPLGDNEDGTSNMVAEVVNNKPDAEFSRPVYEAILSWHIYHLHDTSSTAAMRHYEIVQDSRILRVNGSNIAPFLLNLKYNHQREYKEILNAVRLVTPFFDDFRLEPIRMGEKEVVNLSWIQKGSDYPMQPYHLSDGSIRFICLAAALLQPTPPSTIIIDEPELGLHPAAITILAELIQAASKRTQVIIATQSPALVDQFAIEDIIVANREDGASTFKRLKEEDFSEWLNDYSIGELWSKNVIPGAPVYE